VLRKNYVSNAKGKLAPIRDVYLKPQLP